MPKLKYLFTVPRGERVTEKHLRRVLASSVAGILLCMTCLVSTTWAWFTVSVTSENNEIHIGSLSIRLCVTDKAGTEIAPDGGTYTLPEGENTLLLNNEGSCRGYGQIFLTDNTGTETLLITPTVPVGGETAISVTVQGGEASMTAAFHWGDAPEGGNITGGLTVGVAETVPPTETMAPPEESSEPSQATEPTEPAGAEQDEASEENTSPAGETTVPPETEENT